jgi:multicomponent Na+:H+ antiporter subunit C
MTLFPYLVAGWIFLAGLYGVATSRNLVHLIVCLTVAQSSTYVLLLGVGFRRHATAPIYGDIRPGHRVVDPVVHALTLTDIVVSATVAALLLSFAVQAHKRFGTVDPDELRAMHG